MNTFRTSPKDYERERVPGLLRSARPQGATSPISFIAFSLFFIGAVFLTSCAWRKPLEIPVCDIEGSDLKCTDRKAAELSIAIPAAQEAGYVCMAPDDLGKLLTACKRERTFGK